MKSIMVVLSGSSVNRNGYCLSIKCLETALNQSWKCGVPSCISHDLHRAYAWTKASSLYIEPGLVRLVGKIYLPEDNEESFNDLHRMYLNNYIFTNFAPYKETLNSKIGSFLSDEARILFTDSAAYYEKGLARVVFKDIFQQQDKDSLVPISSLKQIGPGCFERDGLLLYAHHYFRRSLSRLNAINPEFFKLIENNATRSDLDVKILLDPDMVGLADSYRENLELEYWWGPKFKDDFKIQPGVTRHEASDDLRMFHGISRAEFWWHTQNDILTLECEEVKDIPSFGVDGDSFGCRYVHSMIDSSSKLASHIDGAIRLYKTEQMIERTDTDIASFGRNSGYTKLWRIDGAVDTVLWKELLTHYFRDNKLIGEYLGGEDTDAISTPVSMSTVTDPIIRYIPCKMHQGQGIRISVSYHLEQENAGCDCYAIPYHFTDDDNTDVRYAESDFIEIVKLLRKKGITLEYPKKLVQIAFEDMTINFPLIMHSGERALELSSATISSIKALCEAWIHRGDSRTISFSIGIKFQDRDVYFSFAGHVREMLDWLLDSNSQLPTDTSTLGDWCDNAAKYLARKYNTTIDSPRLNDLLTYDGILYFSRRFIGEDDCRQSFDVRDEREHLHLLIPKENDEILKLVNSDVLQVAMAVQIDGSECSKCNSPYVDCNCSKYLDADIYERVKGRPIGCFWTNCKA